MAEIQVTKNVGVDRSSRASQTREKETRGVSLQPSMLLKHHLRPMDTNIVGS